MPTGSLFRPHLSPIPVNGCLRYNHLVRFRNTLIIGAVLIVPTIAFAVIQTRFSFHKGEINASWQGNGPISAIADVEGVHLKTTGKATFIAAAPISPSAQSALLTTSAPSSIDAFFAWRVKGQDDYFKIPLTILAGKNRETPIILTEFDQWRNGEVTGIGFEFPADAEVTLHSLNFGYWTGFERIIESIRSFWTFDMYSPYSINFLWGPYVVNNTIHRNFIYDFQPPKGLSGTYAANILLILGIAAIAVWAYYKMPVYRRKPKVLELTLLLFIAMWMVFDVRMGSEFLSWVAHDHSTYISQSDDRTFRDRGNFYDFAEFAGPYLQDRKSYVFFASQQWPYLGNMRYITYPSIPGDNYTADDTWVIYDRTDMTVAENGSLLADGEVLVQRGGLLGRFDQFSFVYRVLP